MPENPEKVEIPFQTAQFLRSVLSADLSAYHPEFIPPQLKGHLEALRELEQIIRDAIDPGFQELGKDEKSQGYEITMETVEKLFLLVSFCQLVFGDQGSDSIVYHFKDYDVDVSKKVHVLIEDARAEILNIMLKAAFHD